MRDPSPTRRSADADRVASRSHRQSAIDQAGGDVVEDREVLEQVELLEHEPDSPRPQSGQLPVGDP